MALMQVNFFSQSLMRTVTMNVILPADKMVAPWTKKREEKPFKTLYLLHGVFGNYTDWVSGTRIQRFAEEKNLAVVMPSGDNAFYLNQAPMNNYYSDFIGKELVEITRKMFPLSRKREDTFIAGLSMGGYGALVNGLKYHDTFGCVATLSAALVLEERMKKTNDSPFMLDRRDYAEACFGDLDEALKSDKNPKYLVERLVKEKVLFPNLYICCGLQDGLLIQNKEFISLLQEHHIPVTYEWSEGNHEWDFWDRYIKKIIDWLPLEDEQQGINSGNVK